MFRHGPLLRHTRSFRAVWTSLPPESREIVQRARREGESIASALQRVRPKLYALLRKEVS